MAIIDIATKFATECKLNEQDTKDFLAVIAEIEDNNIDQVSDETFNKLSEKAMKATTSFVAVYLLAMLMVAVDDN